MMNKRNDSRLGQCTGPDTVIEKQANAEQQFIDRINNIKLEKQPERDLWRGIEQALQHKDQKANVMNKKLKFSVLTPMLAIAASLMVVTVISWTTFESGKSVQGAALVAALSKQHNTQKQSLLIRFKDQPAATNNWQQQIDDLDEAAQAIKKALEEEPNNAGLLRMLKNVYEQQMAIIERVHEPSWALI